MSSQARSARRNSRAITKLRHNDGSALCKRERFLIMRLLFLHLLLAALLVSAPARATTLYVSPVGNDHWTGSSPNPQARNSAGPLASLAGARDAIRVLKQLHKLSGKTVVVFATGTYPISSPVIFSPSDSGTASNPIEYCPAPGAKPVISAGRVVSGWRLDRSGLWRASVAPGSEFQQLWVNDQRATLARSPDSVLASSVLRQECAD